MILEKESIWIVTMADYLMYTLTKLGILLIWRQKLRSDSDIAGVPSLSAIVRSINSSGRYSDVHSLFVSRVRKNRMKTETAASGLPLRPMRMIVKPLHQGPTLARIV